MSRRLWSVVRADYRDALGAEWAKLRTEPGPKWLALAVVVMTVGLGVAVSAATPLQAGGSQDPTRLCLTGLYLGQAVIAVLAVMMVTTEYSNGMIRLTLAAVPRRLVVLAAKATVVGQVAAVAGLLAVVASLVAGRLLMPGHGFTPAHGYEVAALAVGSTWRAGLGSVAYLVLIGWLALGIAFAVRDSAASVGSVLGLVYLFPVIASLIPDHHLQKRLNELGPMTAGLAVQATRDLHGLAISPWAGFGVLVAWAAAGLCLGGYLLCRRDV
jgi:ABC-2 type transport system permease protein